MSLNLRMALVTGFLLSGMLLVGYGAYLNRWALFFLGLVSTGIASWLKPIR